MRPSARGPAKISLALMIASLLAAEALQRLWLRGTVKTRLP